MCFHITKDEIQTIKKGLGKKITFVMKDGRRFMISYGVGNGTIYSLPEGDKQFVQYLKSF